MASLANYPETQAAFQELQNELQEFLGQYIPKVASLQAILSSNGVALDRSESYLPYCKTYRFPHLVFLSSGHSREQNGKGIYAHPKSRSGRGR